MKTSFSSKWKSSTQPRKQRKYVYNAPAHTKGRLLGASLAKPLREKYGQRTVRARTGDKVKIVRGSYKGKEGKIERVDVAKSHVFITKIERSKPDGSKSQMPIHPSNIIITELNLEDKKRKAKLESESHGKKSP